MKTVAANFISLNGRFVVGLLCLSFLSICLEFRDSSHQYLRLDWLQHSNVRTARESASISAILPSSAYICIALWMELLTVPTKMTKVSAFLPSSFVA